MKVSIIYLIISFALILIICGLITRYLWEPEDRIIKDSHQNGYIRGYKACFWDMTLGEFKVEFTQTTNFDSLLTNQIKKKLTEETVYERD